MKFNINDRFEYEDKSWVQIVEVTESTVSFITNLINVSIMLNKDIFEKAIFEISKPVFVGNFE